MGKSTVVEITLRKEPSGLMALLPQPGGLRLGAGREGTLQGALGSETPLQPIFSCGGSLSKTISLSSTKLFWASQTLLVGHALVTTLENSLEVSPTLSISSPAFPPPQKCVHVVTQRCIQECSQQCYS